MKKLICDRCGLTLMDRGDVFVVFEGKVAWEEAVRARGSQPRGIFPCLNFIRCGGEIKLAENGWLVRYRRWLWKSNGQ